jgi:hypothetical protein
MADDALKNVGAPVIKIQPVRGADPKIALVVLHQTNNVIPANAGGIVRIVSVYGNFISVIKV